MSKICDHFWFRENFDEEVVAAGCKVLVIPYFVFLGEVAEVSEASALIEIFEVIGVIFDLFTCFVEGFLIIVPEGEKFDSGDGALDFNVAVIS